MTKGSGEPVKKRTKKSETAAKPQPETNRLFTLDVSIASGPMTGSFTKRNPVISRTIEIRGDQSLAVLDQAIFDAFGRGDEHMYEFQMGGKEPMDPNATSYVPSMAMDDPFADKQPAGDVARTTIGSLGLVAGEVFAYWFDFGDDWWHRVEVLAVAAGVPRGKLPKVTRSVGQSPPQYVDWDEER